MTQLFIPPQTHNVPEDFKRWLKERYRGEVKLLWDRVLNRYVLAHLNRSTRRWTPFKVLKRADGSFLPPCEEAKKIIAESICHASEREKFERDTEREERDLQAKERASERDMVRYMIRSNRKRLGGSPPSRVFLGNP